MRLNKLALVGFIVSFFVGLVGMILSIIGLVQIGTSKGTQWGKVFGILGIVIGFIATVVYTIIFAIIAIDGHL